MEEASGESGEGSGVLQVSRGMSGCYDKAKGAAATQRGPCAPKLAFCEPPALLAGSPCVLGCKAWGGGSMDGGGWGVGAPCEMGQNS